MSDLVAFLRARFGRRMSAALPLHGPEPGGLDLWESPLGIHVHRADPVLWLGNKLCDNMLAGKRPRGVTFDGEKFVVECAHPDPCTSVTYKVYPADPRDDFRVARRVFVRQRIDV